MGARIRGHYRIDEAGRVLPVTDVNASLHRFAYHAIERRDPVAERRARLRTFYRVGLSLSFLGLAGMASLPMIERTVVSADADHIASLRRSILHHHIQDLNGTGVPMHHWHRQISND